MRILGIVALVASIVGTEVVRMAVVPNLTIVQVALDRLAAGAAGGTAPPARHVR